MPTLQGLYENESVKLRFDPFLPSDNYNNEYDSLYLEESGRKLKELLKLKFHVYLAHMAYNISLNEFLWTYTLYRKRSYDQNHNQLSSSSDSYYSDILDALDRLVFLIELRLVTCEDNEMNILIENNLLTSDYNNDIMDSYKQLFNNNNNNNNTSSSSTSSSSLREHLTLPRIINVCTILGVARSSLARYYLARCVLIRPILLTQEVSSIVSALTQVSKQLQGINDDDNNNNGSSSGMTKMVDADEYVADICCSINALLLASRDLLPGSILVSDGGATLSASGVQLLSALRSIYEMILPTLAAASTTGSEERNRPNMTAVHVAREACMSSFEEIVCISLNINRQATEIGTNKGKNEIFYVPNEVYEEATIMGLSALMQGADSHDTNMYNNNDNNNDKESQSFKWFDVLLSLSMGTEVDLGNSSKSKNKSKRSNDNMLSDDTCVGALLADYIRIANHQLTVYSDNGFRHPIRIRLEREGLDADYLCESLSTAPPLIEHLGIMQAAGSEQCEDWTADNIGQSNVDNGSTSHSDSIENNDGRAASVDAGLRSLRDVFPSYGNGFLYACLVFYEGYVDKVIDAIVSETLPPALIRMDRTVAVISQGKKGLRGVGQARTKPGSNNNEMVFDIVDNEQLRQQNKERVRLEELQRERDASILVHEYADDYDDQYDDYIAQSQSSKTKNNNNKSSNFQNSTAAVDWRSNMDRIKRFNTLLRQEEEEVAFWDEIKNTNHDQNVKMGKSSKAKRPWRQKHDGGGHDNNNDNEEEASSKNTVIENKTIEKSDNNSNNNSNKCTNQNTNYKSNQNVSIHINGRPNNYQSNSHNNNNNNNNRGGGGRGSGGGTKEKNGNTGRGSKNNNGGGGNNKNNKSNDRNTTSSTSGTSSSSSSSSSQSRPKTKQFDKHHQRERSLKKMSRGLGGF